MEKLLILLLLNVIATNSYCPNDTVIDFENFNTCFYPLQLELPYGDCGVELDSVEDAALQPTVIFKQAEPHLKYMLMMVDPDAPSRYDPRMKFWRHWLVADLEGRSLKSGDIKLNGEILTNYQGPMPPEGSGLHRYQFFLFKQPSSFNSDLVKIKETLGVDSAVDRGRGGFDVSDFVFQHGLCQHLVAAYEYQAARGASNIH